MSTSAQLEKDAKRTVKPYMTVPATILAAGALGYVAYENYQPFRHTVLAVVRCSRVAGESIYALRLSGMLNLIHAEAAVLGAIDYKLTFAKKYPSDEASQEATSQCHERSARRVLKALLANGGAFPPSCYNPTS